MSKGTGVRAWIGGLALGIAVGGSMLSGACAPAAKSEGASRAEAALLTDEQRQKQVESFDVAWEAVRDGHFDPNLNGVDWELAKAELRPRVEAARTVDEARGAISELVARLKQTHFGLIPGESYERIATEPAGSESVPANAAANGAANGAAGETPNVASASPATPNGPRSPGVLGVDVRIIEGRAVVTRVREDTSAYSAGVRPGWVIEKIAGRAVEKHTDSQGEHIGSDALGRATYALAIKSRLDGPVDSRVRVEFLDGRDERAGLELERVQPRGTPAQVANLPQMYVEFESRRLPENIGYIALSIFLDPMKVTPAFENAVRELADTDGMILDLRGNIGGLGVMAIGLGGFFVDERNLKLGTMQTRAGSLNFVLNPRARAYTKPLAILVDEVSLSTSEILAGGLQDIGRARVFGSKTGGAALPSVVKRLPSGDALQYVTANYVSASGRVLEGNGVIPDEPIELTREELLKGTDPVLNAGVRWIRGQSQR